MTLLPMTEGDWEPAYARRAFPTTGETLSPACADVGIGQSECNRGIDALDPGRRLKRAWYSSIQLLRIQGEGPFGL
jgi:hypothetical protein